MSGIRQIADACNQLAGITGDWLATIRFSRYPVEKGGGLRVHFVWHRDGKNWNYLVILSETEADYAHYDALGAALERGLRAVRHRIEQDSIDAHPAPATL